jgi:hypothetical protein
LRSPARLVWIAATLATLFLALPVFAVMSEPQGNLQYFDEEFDPGRPGVPGTLVVKSGFSQGAYGWDLQPGADGELSYTIRKATGQDVTLYLWLYAGGKVTANLWVSLDGGPRTLLMHDPRYVGALVPLPRSARDAATIELDLTADNQSPAEYLLLDRMTYSIGKHPANPSPEYADWALGALVGLLAIPFIGRRPSRLVIALVMASVVGAATEIRIPTLIYAVGSVPPDPDTIAYQFWADKFEWWPLNQGVFCGCWGPREPLWIAAGHLLTQIFGSSTFHLRAATTMLSIGDVVLAIVAARRRLSWPGALAVGVLVALNGNVISNATRGLRTELEMTLCLTLYALLDRDAAKRPYAEAAVSGLVGAALVLTRTFFLPVVIAVQAISLLSRYRPVRRSLVLLAIAGILPLAGTVAQRLALYEFPRVEYGLSHDPFLDTDSYARWLANNEKFIAGEPLPHPELFPTTEEFKTCGPYCGPRLTYFQYLFVLHTPQQVVTYSLEGYGDVLINTGGFLRVDPSYLTGDPSVVIPPLLGPIGDWMDSAVRALGVLGLLVMTLTGLRRPRNLLVPVMFVGILGFAVFLYHLHLIELYYNVVQAWPFLFIAAGWVVESGVRLAADVGFRRRLIDLWTRYRHRAPIAGFGTLAIGGALGLHLATSDTKVVAALLAVTCVGIAGACLLDAAAGGALMLAALMLAPGPGLAAAAAAFGLASLWLKCRPERGQLLPASAVLPFAIAAATSGLGVGGWHPHRAGLEIAVLAVSVPTSFVIICASPERSRTLLWSLSFLLPVLLPTAALLLPDAGVDAGRMSIALKLAEGHPLFGLGWGGLVANLGPGFNVRDQYAQSAAEGGLVGLVGLLTMLAAAAWSARLLGRATRIALQSTLAILLIGMGFESVLAVPAGVVLVLGLVGLSVGLPILAPHAAPKRA